MRTYRLIDTDIKMYVMDDEIIPYLKSSPELLDIYEEIKNAEGVAIVPLVAMEDDLKAIYNLDIIVKHPTKSKYGFFEYYFTGDFVNKNTNLFKLIEALAEATHVDTSNLLDAIRKQLYNFTNSLNYELKLCKETRKKKMFFSKASKFSSLN